MARGSYHHGDLRAALIDAALAMVAEKDITALSVAEAAHRTGVSAAAPYRHFPNRKALLAAVVTTAAREFDAEVRAAIPPRPDGDLGDWALDAMAATAESYVRFVVRRRIGWDVIFGSELSSEADQDRHAAGRSLNDAFLEPAIAVTGGDILKALALVEHEIVSAHGYATLYLAGLFGGVYPEIGRAAAQAAAITRIRAIAARDAR